jgi:hypothetical protein
MRYPPAKQTNGNWIDGRECNSHLAVNKGEKLCREILQHGAAFGTELALLGSMGSLETDRKPAGRQVHFWLRVKTRQQKLPWRGDLCR